MAGVDWTDRGEARNQLVTVDRQEIFAWRRLCLILGTAVLTLTGSAIACIVAVEAHSDTQALTLPCGGVVITLMLVGASRFAYEHWQAADRDRHEQHSSSTTIPDIEESVRAVRREDSIIERAVVRSSNPRLN
jgi:hypothetical protein